MKTRGRRLFSKEIRLLMYGFGDVSHPMTDTVELMEDCLLEYLSDMCTLAVASKPNPLAKLKTSDFLRVVGRDDPVKLARAHELLSMDREIKRARATFDVPDLSVKPTKKPLDL